MALQFHNINLHQLLPLLLTDTCGVAEQLSKLIRKCIGGYDIRNEQTTDFGRKWSRRPDMHNWPEYIYRTDEEMDGSPYLGKCMSIISSTV